MPRSILIVQKPADAASKHPIDELTKELKHKRYAIDRVYTKAEAILKLRDETYKVVITGTELLDGNTEHSWTTGVEVAKEAAQEGCKVFIATYGFFDKRVEDDLTSIDINVVYLEGNGAVDELRRKILAILQNKEVAA